MNKDESCSLGWIGGWRRGFEDNRWLPLFCHVQAWMKSSDLLLMTSAKEYMNLEHDACRELHGQQVRLKEAHQ